jgi:hypothetical protein
MNFVGFKLQAPKCELKGTQMCNLLNANGEEPKVIMAECVCLFEPSAFGGAADASRVSLSLELNEPIRATIEEIESFLLKEAQRLQLFGGADEDELKSRFQSAIKTPAGFKPYLRVKMCFAGGREVRLWGSNGRPREAPAKWQGCHLKVNLAVRGIYMNPSDWGGLLEATDCLVTEAEESQACPFQT